MANFHRETITTTEIRYVIPSGSPIAEFSKAYSNALAEVPQALQGYDDCLHVRAADDEIHIYFTRKET